MTTSMWSGTTDIPAVGDHYVHVEDSNIVYKITAVGVLTVLMLQVEDRSLGLRLWPPKFEQAVPFEGMDRYRKVRP